jgi:hypothetical protein
VRLPTYLLALAFSVLECKSRVPSETVDATTPVVTSLPPTGRLVGTTCELPLALACDKARGCPSYPEALAEIHALATNPREWGRAEAGTCGDGHYTLTSVWYMTVRSYFDRGGTMIGAQHTVDNLNQYCEGKAGTATFGVIPTCKPRPTDVVLDGGPR